MITESQIADVLRTVKYPGFSRDIVSFGLVKGIVLDGANVTVKLELATRDANIPRQIHAAATAALEAVPGIGKISLDFDIKEPEVAAGATGRSSIPGVK